ncbi:hypothetical protein K461DRAFT_97040 [Myriangium duriaei CBS 260.36]|uniref:Uncharacterized protein n=1 Tax=Myriangium duriaei CBS 260.36 TaxID=1168546 RepID=A0A9P4J845_9PEZI|nr:hypothetical protein K461DRAFT_97040 [Myriangium duriaei CBS 260.36]
MRTGIGWMIVANPKSATPPRSIVLVTIGSRTGTSMGITRWCEVAVTSLVFDCPSRADGEEDCTLDLELCRQQWIMMYIDNQCLGSRDKWRPGLTTTSADWKYSPAFDTSALPRAWLALRSRSRITNFARGMTSENLLRIGAGLQWTRSRVVSLWVLSQPDPPGPTQLRDGIEDSTCAVIRNRRNQEDWIEHLSNLNQVSSARHSKSCGEVWGMSRTRFPGRVLQAHIQALIGPDTPGSGSRSVGTVARSPRSPVR